MRFFAFLKIYLTHVPVQGDFPLFSFIRQGGGIGVTFFFVLSGFLITYLLSTEKKQRQRISPGSFFLRRSLRIWPLFFFWVVLAFALPPRLLEQAGFYMTGGGYNPEWLYSFTFLENYKMLIEDNFPKTTPLPVFWSLCIEEHFYLLWMLVFYFIPLKKIPLFLAASVFLSWPARLIEPHLFPSQLIVNNDLFTNLDLFATGGLAGYFVAMDFDRVSSFINRVPLWVRYSVIIATLLAVLFQKQVFHYDPGSWWFIFTPTAQAVLFTLLICTLIARNSPVRIGSRNPLSYLGRISYGLYVYHIVLIHAAFRYCMVNDIVIDSTARLLLFIAITLGASIVVSAASYRWLESPFLRLRDRLEL